MGKADFDFERISQNVDKVIPSPSKRAEYVWKFLPKEEMSNWTLACFCIESLALLSNTDLLAFKPHVKELNRLLYQFHYQAPDKIGLLTPEQYELCK